MQNKIDANAILERLEKLLENSQSDDLEIKRRWEEAMATLPEAIVQEITDAYAKQIQAAVLFCGALGFEANRTHFKEPLYPVFLDFDPEEYLQERVLWRMPAYADAQENVNRLRKELPDAVGDIFLDYYTYLEMAGTRLAHYYGYLFGNELLPYIEPGYSTDMLLTGQYQSAIKEWYGI